MRYKLSFGNSAIVGIKFEAIADTLCQSSGLPLSERQPLPEKPCGCSEGQPLSDRKTVKYLDRCGQIGYLQIGLFENLSAVNGAVFDSEHCAPLIT